MDLKEMLELGDKYYRTNTYEKAIKWYRKAAKNALYSIRAQIEKTDIQLMDVDFAKEDHI